MVTHKYFTQDAQLRELTSEELDLPVGPESPVFNSEEIGIITVLGVQNLNHLGLVSPLH